MKSILYMLRKCLKNGIIDTFHHPLQLVVYIFIILSIIGGLTVSLTTNIEAGNASIFDFRILEGAYLIILYFISVPIMLKGTNASATFFKLSDVANVFTAPISEKRILIYGVGRQMVTVVALLFCFVSYAAMAVRYFSLTVWDAVLLMCGVGVMLFEVQMITVLIFCACNGRPGRIRLMKYAIYLIVVIPIAVVLFELFAKGFTYENILCAVSLPYLDFIPVIGWTSGLFMGIVTGETARAALLGVLIAAFTAFTIIVFLRSKADYYEDVLQKTESVYEFKNAIKTGKVSDKMMLESKNIKVGSMGINRGSGASVFFYKQMREMSRRSRIPFINVNTAVLTCFVLIVGFALKTFNIGYMSPSVIITVVAILSCYIQFFFTVSDDWVKELQKPYIFMVPDKSVSKLVTACATSVLKPLVDGVIAFAIGGIVFGVNPLDTASCMIVYFSCGLLYTSLNVLVQRFMGKEGNRGVIMVVYMLLLFIALLPGLVISMLLFIFLPGGAAQGAMIAARLCLPSASCNIIISLLIFFMCRRSLENMEY